MNRQQLSSVWNKRPCATTATVPSLVCTGEKQERKPRPTQATECSYDKDSMQIDAVMKTNMAVTDDILDISHHFASPSPEIRLSRDIYSPVPQVTSTETDSLEYLQEEESGPQRRISLSPKTKFDSKSGISFPAIKVECCDGEVADSAKVPTKRNDIKDNKNDSADTKMSETDIDFYTQSKSKSLLVPTTLVRRKSTDGRLIIGLRDNLGESNLLNLSRAWSRSEGNIPVMSSAIQQSMALLHPPLKAKEMDYTSGRQLHKFNSQDKSLKLGKPKPILKPIKQSNDVVVTSDVDQKSPSLPDSTDSLNSLDNMRISPIQVNDNGLYFPRRLNGTQDPKPRAKSSSPRRLNHLEPLPPTSSASSSDSMSPHGRVTRQTARFLSPQPKRKLLPILRDNDFDRL